MSCGRQRRDRGHAGAGHGLRTTGNHAQMMPRSGLRRLLPAQRHRQATVAWRLRQRYPLEPFPPATISSSTLAAGYWPTSNFSRSTTHDLNACARCQMPTCLRGHPRRSARSPSGLISLPKRNLGCNWTRIGGRLSASRRTGLTRGPVASTLSVDESLDVAVRHSCFLLSDVQLRRPHYGRTPLGTICRPQPQIRVAMPTRPLQAPKPLADLVLRVSGPPTTITCAYDVGWRLVDGEACTPWLRHGTDHRSMFCTAESRVSAACRRAAPA